MNLDPHDVGVGKRLSRLRKFADMVQIEFALALGVSQPALINYEQGRRPLPSKALLHIYERFNVDPLWILCGPEPDPRPYSPEVDLATFVAWGKKIDRALKSAGREYTQELRDRLVAFCAAQQRKHPNKSVKELLEMAVELAA